MLAMPRFKKDCLGVHFILVFWSFHDRKVFFSSLNLTCWQCLHVGMLAMNTLANHSSVCLNFTCSCSNFSIFGLSFCCHNVILMVQLGLGTKQKHFRVKFGLKSMFLTLCIFKTPDTWPVWCLHSSQMWAWQWFAEKGKLPAFWWLTQSCITFIKLKQDGSQLLS